MPKELKPVWVAMVKGEARLFLLMTEEPVHLIRGWKSEAEAAAYFTDSYNRKHDQSYEGSISACIHFIQYQPKILRFKDMEELKATLLTDDIQLYSLWAVSGGFTAIECHNSKAQAAYDAGISPALITEKNPDEEPAKHSIRSRSKGKSRSAKDGEG